MKKLDLIDRKILEILQEDATLAIADVAARIGLSQTPCWRRIQKLRADGVIRATVALVSPEALGLGLTVFMSIEAVDHSPQWLERFTAAVCSKNEILEVHRMSGDVDYLLKVAVTDMAAFDAFYRNLIAMVPLKNVSSNFAMERVRSTTAYPVTI